MTEVTNTHHDLRDWRKASGLTLSAMARLLEITRPTAYSWEKGHYPRDLKARMDRAQALLAERAQP